MVVIRAALATVVALLLGSSAGAGVIYDNLGPSNALTSIGYMVGLFDFDNADYWLGFQFIATQSGVVGSIDAPVTAYFQGDQPLPVTFQLYSDTAGSVGVLLEEIPVVATQFYAPGSVPVESGLASRSTSLIAGTPYWLMATASGPGQWQANGNGDSLPWAYSSSGPGGTLSYIAPDTAGGFRINSVPEPSTLLIMGGVLVALGFVGRSRRL